MHTYNFHKSWQPTRSLYISVLTVIDLSPSKKKQTITTLQSSNPSETWLVSHIDSLSSTCQDLIIHPSHTFFWLTPIVTFGIRDNWIKSKKTMDGSLKSIYLCSAHWPSLINYLVPYICNVFAFTFLTAVWPLLCLCFTYSLSLQFRWCGGMTITSSWVAIFPCCLHFWLRFRFRRLLPYLHSPYQL